MEIIPLGINGYIPTHGRHTTSFLMVDGGTALLLDAGTGVARLGEPGIQERLAPCETLHVVLSHYHLDHVVGLFYLSGVWSRGVHLHGAAPPLVESTPEEAIEQLMGTPLSPKPLSASLDPFEMSSITGQDLVIGSFNLSVWAQPHPGGSMGIRVNDQVAFMTDRAMNTPFEDQAEGVDLLIHELWLTDEEARTNPAALNVHSNLSGLADFARARNVKSVMPIHHHPSRTQDDIDHLSERLEQQSGIPVINPMEGHGHELP